MVISALIEKIQKDLSNMWHSETELPEYVPGGYAGRTIPKNQVSIGNKPSDIFISRLYPIMREMSCFFQKNALLSSSNPLILINP